MKNKDLIFEIGCEELPSSELVSLEQQLADNIRTELLKANLSYDGVQSFATPRRLAILVTNLASSQESQTIHRKGPSISQAFNSDGSPTPAAIGFAKSCGVAVTELEHQDDKWLVFNQTIVGAETKQLLPNIITNVINKVRSKKKMRWGSNTNGFVRPVHWILVIYAADIIPVSLFGIQSDRITYGHRFHAPQPITIKNANDYPNAISDAKVIANFKQRQEIIEQKIIDLLSPHGLQAVISKELLEVVTTLVEYPVVLLGKFDKSHLSVPTECLISSIEQHQKCFAIIDSTQKLTEQFVLVSNIQSSDPQTVIAGNQKVINARLADAAFYYQQDQKTPLKQRTKQLSNIIFQKTLGTMQDKVNRIADLSCYIGEELDIDKDQCILAANLCKADLLTNMVYEFPELQGVMGYYYALIEGYPEHIAIAIRDHYLPRFANDALADDKLSITLALADRIDTLVGFFAIGKQPTGDKDPFALRRQALAIIRICIKHNIDLDIVKSCKYAAQLLPNNLGFPDKLIEFFTERLKVWYQDKSKLIDAALINNQLNLYDLQLRVTALEGFLSSESGSSLIAANKRVAKLLARVEMNTSQSIDSKLLSSGIETDLAMKVVDLKQQLTTINDYSQILQLLSQLKQPIDEYFDNVMIMVEDKQLQLNRLTLLRQLRELFLTVADLSKL